MFPMKATENKAWMASLKLRSVKTFSCPHGGRTWRFPHHEGKRYADCSPQALKGIVARPLLSCATRWSANVGDKQSWEWCSHSGYPFSLAISKLSWNSSVAHISFVTHSTILNCCGNFGFNVLRNLFTSKSHEVVLSMAKRVKEPWHCRIDIH